MSGGGGGSGYDAEYNKAMSTLAEFQAGLGFNDYLRQYGYQLNPQLGGVTNPMYAYQYGTGQEVTAPNFQQPVDINQLAPSRNVDQFGQPQVTTYRDEIPDYETVNSTTVGGVTPEQYQQMIDSAPVRTGPQMFTGGQQQTGAINPYPYGFRDEYGQEVPIADSVYRSMGISVPGQQQQMLPGQQQQAISPFVRALDAQGNPIVSAIDLENQQNALNYALRPEQQQYLMAGLQSETGLIPQRGALESQQIGAQQTLLPYQTGLTMDQLSAARSLLPGQTALSAEQTGSQRRILPYSEAAQIAGLTAEEQMAPMRVEQLQGLINNLEAKTSLTRAEQQFLEGARTELTQAQAVASRAQANLANAQAGRVGLFTQGQRQVQPGQVQTVNAINEAIQSRLAQTAPGAQQQRISERRGEATAGVQQSFNPSALRASLGRAGVSGQSGQFADAMANLAFERSKALSGARYRAAKDVREEARQEQADVIRTGVSALPNY